MRAAAIKEAFNRSHLLLHPVMHLLLRSTQARITQMAQTAVCNRHHTLDQQLCRWLLPSLDRLPGNQLLPVQAASGCPGATGRRQASVFDKAQTRDAGRPRLA